jgi:hypothetical protein
MPYQFHIFLSYRRHREWPEWVRDKFLPIFQHWLGEELGEDDRTFFDQEIETGTAWPHRLAQALAESRILVPLWSRQYFSSPWCRAELTHMLAREKACGFGTAKRPEGLIVPAIIHDGEDIPSYARQIQAVKLSHLANIRIAKNSSTEEELSAQIRNWMPEIVQAIRRAPIHDPGWRELATADFLTLFTAIEPKQEKPPSLGNP